MFFEAFERTLSWQQRNKTNYKPRTRSKRRFSAAFEGKNPLALRRGPPGYGEAVKKQIVKFCETNSEPVPSRYVIIDDKTKAKAQVHSLIKPFNFLTEEFNKENNSSMSEATFKKYVKDLKIYKKFVQISGQCDHCTYRKSCAIKVNRVIITF